MFADADGAEAISRRLSADQWFTAEIPDDAVNYFYWQGSGTRSAPSSSVIEERIAELWPARAASCGRCGQLASTRGRTTS
jgi:hypothetical protein